MKTAMKLKPMKLTKYERRIEQELLRGEWVPVGKAEFNRIARMLARHKKKVVVRVKISQGDLDALKVRAKREGVTYQTFITNSLCRFVHSS